MGFQLNKPKIIKSVNMNFIPVKEINDLPSRMLAYPAGSKVSCRPYTFGELKKYNQSGLSLEEGYNFILEGIETSFPKQNLTLGDFIFLSVYRRAFTFGGSNFYIEYFCEGCKSKSRLAFSYSNMEFEHLDVKALPLTVKLNNYEIKIVPITVLSYLKLASEGKEIDEIALLAASVINYKFEDAFKIINNLVGEDILLMEEVDRMLYHGVKPLKSVCKNITSAKEAVEPVYCNTESYLGITNKQALIFSEGVNPESVRSRILYGV